MPEINERTKKAMERILTDFEHKMATFGSLEDEASREAIIGLLAEFGLDEEEFVIIAGAMMQFFILNSVPMQQGIQLSMLVGMILGREMDSELRHEAGL